VGMTNKELSIVRVENIWAEDLFKWAYERVINDGGDGYAAIICENYDEVARWFDHWIKRNYSHHCNYLFHKSDDIVYYTTGEHSQEGFLFAGRILNMFYHDYNFVVVGDCLFAHDNVKESPIRAVKAIND
jgi:hypothetical protein